MGGGVCLLDYDGDGLLDIFCVQGATFGTLEGSRTTHRLYRNLGDWQFEDVTDQAGLREYDGYGMGCACADYNNDGLIDIYVTQVGVDILLRNNGDGTFSDVTREAGFEDPGWSASAAFFDYDGDGFLDLMVVNYIHWAPGTEIACYSRGGARDYCSPMSYSAPATDRLYRNRGDGSFEDVTFRMGLGQARGTGLGVATGDFDMDGRTDIYVANDAMPNHLWINRGDSFSNEAMIRGAAVNYVGMSEAGMGVVAADIFQRGALDLFVTHLVGEANRLYVNTSGFFIDTVQPSGPGAPSWPFTGFGVAFADFDNDGILDLYIANGRVKYGASDYDPADPYAEPNNLLVGYGAGVFREAQPHGGTQPPLIGTSRGLAVGDLNNDGALDIVIVNRDGPAHLLRNISAGKRSWIMFEILNQNGAPALNASVSVEAGGKVFWRQVQPNEGYLSSHGSRIHVGFDSAEFADLVTVRWPDGTKSTHGPFPAQRLHSIRQ